MKKTATLLLALALLLGACGKSEPEGPSWREQYNLGLRYLEEGNYQEAVIAFEAAIEIDPARADAYVSLAEAYTALGEPDRAREVLEQGLEAVDGEDAPDLRSAMTDMEAPETPPESAGPAEGPDEDGRDEDSPEDIALTLSAARVTMYMGNTWQLTVRGLPEGAAVTWASDSDAVTVDGNGLVTADNARADTLDALQAAVTASCAYGGRTYTATCTVTANAPRVTFSPAGPLEVGETLDLRDLMDVSFAPASVRYISSDPAVAAVSNDGTVTAVSPGTVLIAAAAKFPTDLGMPARQISTEGGELPLEADEYGGGFLLEVTEPAMPYPEFDNTYWNIAFGVTIGSQYTCKLFGDGTILACQWNSIAQGTFTYEDGVLTILSFREIGNGYTPLHDQPQFVWNGEEYLSVKEYEMQMEMGRYGLSPTDGAYFEELYSQLSQG